LKQGRSSQRRALKFDLITATTKLVCLTEGGFLLEFCLFLILNFQSVLYFLFEFLERRSKIAFYFHQIALCGYRAYLGNLHK